MVKPCVLCRMTSSDYTVLPCCGGKWTTCKQCMISYVRERITTYGAYDIPCPISAVCKKWLPHRYVKSLLSHDGTLSELYSKIELSHDPSRNYCPNCNNIVTKINKKINLRRTTCSTCGYVFCFDCMRDWTTTSKWYWWHSCNLDKFKFIDTTDEIDTILECPDCNRQIEISYPACDTAYCICATEFCKICRTVLNKRNILYLLCESHKYKYSVMGCTYVLYPNYPILRKLIRGAIFTVKIIGIVTFSPALVLGFLIFIILVLCIERVCKFC